MKGYFIAGTDTGVGKTEISLGLVAALQQRGQRVATMKPVASGSALTTEGLRNDDALRLQARASITADYSSVNPYALAPPIAPHVAAAEQGVRISIAHIQHCFGELARNADQTVVEGVGGWLVPLGGAITTEDLAVALGLPVVLVVGLRLGCLNHALLTGRAIAASGLAFAGWVANLIDPATLRIEENIDYLRQALPAPLMGIVPHLAEPQPAVIARYLSSP